MKPLERKLFPSRGIFEIIIGIFWLMFNFLFLRQRFTLPWDPFSWKYFMSLLFFGVYFIFEGVFNLIYAIRIYSTYQNYPSDDLCDHCGVKVENIKLNDFGDIKKILCKKCHIKHELIFIIIFEILVVVFILFLIFNNPPTSNISEILFNLFIIISFAIVIPILSLIRIKRGGAIFGEKEFV